MFKCFFHFFPVSFSTADKIFKKYHIINNFYMKGKEGSIVSDTDAIDILVAHKMLAVGHLLDVLGLFDFDDDTTNRLQHLAGEPADGFLKTFGVCNLHTPNQFSKASFSRVSSFCLPSGSDLDKCS